MRVKEYVALIFTFILPHGLQECVSIHLFFLSSMETLVCCYIRNGKRERFKPQLISI